MAVEPEARRPRGGARQSSLGRRQSRLFRRSQVGPRARTETAPLIAQVVPVLPGPREPCRTSAALHARIEGRLALPARPIGGVLKCPQCSTNTAATSPSPKSQGLVAGDALRHRPDRRRHAEAAGRHRQHVVRGQPVQHAPARPGREGERRALQAAGLVGMRFNTIGVSDGISMGTDGMSYSLQSRDIIADSIETVMGAQWYDACIALPGCDKNMPGCIMAMGRLNRPGIHGLRRHDSGRRHRRTTAKRSTSSRRSHAMGAVHGRNDIRRASGKMSSGTRVPAPAPAAACTRPTRWPRPSRRWA